MGVNWEMEGRREGGRGKGDGMEGRRGKGDEMEVERGKRDGEERGGRKGGRGGILLLTSSCGIPG